MFRPTDFGAVGDGVHDDGPALNAMFQAALATGRSARIDLSGEWWTAEPVLMVAPPASDIVAGGLRVLDAASLEVALVVSLGRGCTVVGTLRVGGRVTSHLAKRNVVYGVRIALANTCTFGGFAVDHVSRYGVSNVPGANLIGAGLGRIRAASCGAPGHPGAPAHTRATTTATEIVREGSPGSPQQRALIRCGALPVHSGDYLSIGGTPAEGGHLCEVVAAEPGGIRVYPWPGALRGAGEWRVDALIGGAVRLSGGNTAQVTLSGVVAQYCGHALHVVSLYGCNATGVLGEMVGSALTLGARSSALRGASVTGLHAEATLTDVLVGGLSVERAVVIAPAEPVVRGKSGYQVRPVDGSGAPAPYAWPVTTVP